MPLGKALPGAPESRLIGLEVADAHDLGAALRDNVGANRGDVVVVPLTYPRHVRNARQLRKGIQTGRPTAPFADAALLMATQWSSQVIGMTSTWIDLGGGSGGDEELRRDSERALREEISWAAHLCLPAVVVQLPEPCATMNFARVLLALLPTLAHTQVWLRLTVAAEEDEDGRSKGQDPWETFNAVRTLCGLPSNLFVALDIPADLPSCSLSCSRYFGEMVKMIFIPTSIFLTNKRGYPALSRMHQHWVKEFWSRNAMAVLQGKDLHSARNGALEDKAESEGVGYHPLHLYIEYLSYLYRKAPELSDSEKLEANYRDVLQNPLQPLMDNLESQTYEIFEKDAVKYQLYEDAILQCLCDRNPARESDPAKQKPPPSPQVVIVVGAGRGPLVRSALQASERCGHPIRLYAVEKNPNAMTILQCLVEAESWKARGFQELVHEDMRTWNAPEQADILVSELLGSFGDNELSPECLDGAQRFLKEDGVSIPQSYTSYLAPIMASKVHTALREYRETKQLETPYVVKLHAAAELAPYESVFTFSHPNSSEEIDNSRYMHVEFQRDDKSPSCQLDGFAGTFDAILYKDVHLSTYPPTHSPNMFSWFPLFFPLQHPVSLPPAAHNSKLAVDIWRVVSPSKVWYEWALCDPVKSLIHNPLGRSYWVGL